MNANPPPDDLNEELMTRWIDGQLTPAELETVERALTAQPHLSRERDSALMVGGLLRRHLPATLEPPSADFFTSRIMEEIRSAPPVMAGAGVPGGKPSVRRAGMLSWLKQPWFAPLASAAAVALLFLAANGSRPPVVANTAARAYAPDPNVVPHSFYSEEASAMVIDLKGLQAVPDDREIRAFDVADAAPAAPGRPLVLHAASQPDRAVLVLAPDSGEGPKFRELQ